VDRAADDQAVLAAASHLIDRDCYLVRMIAEHRVLTTDQGCALNFDNITAPAPAQRADRLSAGDAVRGVGLGDALCVLQFARSRRRASGR
jgi:hypothetical protein